MKIPIFEKKAFFGHTSFIKVVINGTIAAECNSIPHEGFSQAGYNDKTAIFIVLILGIKFSSWRELNRWLEPSNGRENKIFSCTSSSLIDTLLGED